MNQWNDSEHTCRTETAAKLDEGLTEMLRFYLERAQPVYECRAVELPSGEKRLEITRLFYQSDNVRPEVADMLRKMEVKFDPPMIWSDTPKRGTVAHE